MGLLFFFLLLFLTFFGQSLDPELKVILVGSIGSGIFLARRRIKDFIPSEFVIFYLLFWSVNILASIFSIHLYPSLLKDLEQVAYLFIILSIPLIAKNQKITNVLILGILIIGLLASLAGISHYLFVQKPRIALTQPLGWHTTTASLLILAIPLALVRFLETKDDKKPIKIFYFLINFFLITALLLTFSKGAYVSFVLEVVILFFLLKKVVLKIPKKALAYLAVGSLTLIILTGTIYGGGRIIPGQVTLGKFKISYIQRSYTLEKASAMISAKPLFGWGPATFPDVFRKYQGRPWLYASSAHNQYLEMATEGGLLVLLLFLGLLFIILRAFLKQYGRKAVNSETKMTIGLFAGISGFLIHNLFESNLIIPILSLIFWTEAGAILFLADSKAGANNMILKKVLSLLAIMVLVSSFFLTWHYSQFKSLQKTITRTDVSKENLLQAAQKLEKLFSTLPNEKYLFWQAQAYSRLGKNHLAVEKLRETHRHHPYNPEILYRLAQLHYEDENLASTSAFLEEAINFNPYTNTKYHLFLANIYLELNKEGEAKKVLEEALNLYFPKNEAYYAYKYIYDFTGDSRNLEIMEELLSKIE